MNQQENTCKPIYTPCTTSLQQKQKIAAEGPETDIYRKLEEWVSNNEKDGGTYLKSRGISMETQRRFKIGLAFNWTHPKTGTFGPSKRCIIPTGEDSYLARAVDNHETKQKPKAGKAQPFNMTAVIRAARSNSPVYIVEGEIDAMSLEEVNENAVGLGSISWINQFFNALDEMEKEIGRTRPGFIICMDQEAEKEHVRRAATALGEGLAKRGFFAIVAPKFPNVNGKAAKDTNELLTLSPESLTAWAANCSAVLSMAIEDYKEKWIKEFTGGFDLFRKHLEENKNLKPIDTGFYELNRALGGGLHNGLYFIGAVSSLGKTTFALQIADNIAAGIAANGSRNDPRPVLYFTLEMSRDEMIAKSLSRMSSQKAEQKGYSIKNGISKNRILQSGFSGERGALVLEAMAEYETTNSKNICFIEGVGDICARKIRGSVERFTQINKIPPVVVVDYLQIMAAECTGLTDKQAVDKNVLELKRISRDFKTPVIAICSLNREAYEKEVSLKSFKETGAIEYTADGVIGLQFSGVGETDFNEPAAKARAAENDKNLNERLIECRILKNRNWICGLSVNFKYYPAHEYFKENEDNTGF